MSDDATTSWSLGVGHAPVGQVGPGLRRVRRWWPRRAALADAGVAWTTSSSCPAPTPSATATRASSPGRRSPRPGLDRRPACRPALRRLRLGRAGAAACARAEILAGFCDVALVVGADTTPKGFFAPVGRRAPHRPRLAALPPRSAPPTPRTSPSTPAGAWTCYGATVEDFARVKVKNARHGLRQPQRPVPQGGRRRRGRWPSPMVADPLRLLDICATSDGGAAVVLASADFARARRGSLDRRRAPAGRLDGDADVPATPCSTCPSSPPTRPPCGAAPERTSGRRIAAAAYEEAGVGPDDLDLRRGLRPVDGARAGLVREHRPVQAEGEAEALLRSGATTDRRPHPGQPQRRPGLLRRGHPRPGAGPGVRADLAAAGPGRRPPGRGRPGRHHRQPGPVRPRLVGRRSVTVDQVSEDEIDHG